MEENKFLILERIAINKLRDLYQSLSSKNNQISEKKILNFNYLNLSIFYSRDDREFDINNFKLIKKLFKNNSIDKIKTKIKKNKKISGYLKYLFSLKESNYLSFKKLPIVLFIDLLKYLKQILDIIGIYIIVFFTAIKNAQHVGKHQNGLNKIILIMIF